MNSTGRVFRVTTWGESHGPAMGAVIEGCPGGMPLGAEEITTFLNQMDRPRIETATAREEDNRSEILSGVFNGKTIGTPISVIIRNTDIRSKDYSSLDSSFRPGHGDYTYYAKHNLLPLPGGGRASGRECISRLAAGYIAGKLIKSYFPGYSTTGTITRMAGIRITSEKDRITAIERAVSAGLEGDSTGGEIKIHISGIPAGIGEPVFGALDALLASAVMSIGGIKSVSIGSAGLCADARGSFFNDQFCLNNEEQRFATNHAGGILSGITNGEEIIITAEVKPVPSIELPQTAGTAEGGLRKISVTGRHDTNITPRVIPVAEAMVSLVLADALILGGRISKEHLNRTAAFPAGEYKEGYGA